MAELLRRADRPPASPGASVAGGSSVASGGVGGGGGSRAGDGAAAVAADDASLSSSKIYALEARGLARAWIPAGRMPAATPAKVAAAQWARRARCTRGQP